MASPMRLLLLLFCSSYVVSQQLEPQYLKGTFAGENWFRIGCPYTGSGRFASFGAAFKTSWKLWQDYIHLTVGGLRINGMTYGVEFVLIDVGAKTLAEMVSNTGNVTQNFVNGMYGGPVHVIIAPYSSTLTPIAAKYAPNLPVIAPGAAADSVYTCAPNDCFNTTSNRRFGNLFGVLATASHYFDAILNFARVKKMKRVAFVWEGDTFGQDTCNAAIARAGLYNMTVTYQKQLDSGVVYTDIIKAVKQSNPDLFIQCTYPDVCVNMTQAARTVGWAANATALATCVGNPTMDNFGPEYIIGPTQWTSSAEDITHYEPNSFPFPPLAPVFMYPRKESQSSPAQFYDAYMRASGGQRPIYQAAAALAGMYALHFALVITNTTDGRALIEGMGYVRMGLPTFWGALGFDDLGRLSATSDFTILQYQANAELQLIAPLDLATADLAYPAPTYVQRTCTKQGKCGDFEKTGTCQRDGSCVCQYGYQGTDCKTKLQLISDVKSLLEQDHCTGLYGAVVALVILLLITLIIIGAYCFWNRRRFQELIKNRLNTLSATKL